MTLGRDTLQQHRRGTVFVETGTYRGDGIRAALDAGFQTVYSIELDDALFERATRLFGDDERVHLVHGDSAVQLRHVLADLEAQDVTVWLDAHASGPLRYDGGTPVINELEAVASSGCRATILIDDCRLFGSAEWRYITKDDILRAVAALPYEHTITYADGYAKDDIMVIKPI